MKKNNPINKSTINRIIKRSLANSTKDFIYLRDLKQQLDSLSFNRGFPITSTQGIARFLNLLEKENQLHHVPFARKNGKGDQWKFYSLDKVPLTDLDSISDFIDFIVEKISLQGFAFMVKPKEKEQQKEEHRKLVDKLIELSVLNTDYPFSEDGDNTQLKNYLQNLPQIVEATNSEELNELRKLFNSYTMNKELAIFLNKNLGPLENTWENGRLVIYNIIKKSKRLSEIKLFQNILFLSSRTHIVNNVSEYLQVVNQISLQTQNEIFYRGQGNHLWKDLPGIYRNSNVAKNEHLLFKEMILKNPNDFILHNTTFEKLTKMQHYELPTRLLDITSNPLVALYFATSNTSYDKTPSEVILYSVKTNDIKYYDSDQVSVLANLAQREKDFEFLDDTLKQFDLLKSQKLQTKHTEKSLIKGFNEQGEIMYLHHTIRGEKPYFLPIIDPRHLCTSVVVKSKLDNERIKKQDGAFIIVGINRNNCLEPAPIDFYLKNKEGNRIRIIISESDENGNNNIQNIRKELDRLSYNKGSLFPEIMNSAQYIKDKYLNS